MKIKKVRKVSALEKYLTTLTTIRLIEKESELSEKLSYHISETEYGLITMELPAVRWELRNRKAAF